MSEHSQQIFLSPADFADTGQWRLIVQISHTGMTGLLKHATDTTRPLVQIVNAKWDYATGGELLRRIENTVYDHPSMLDDYATEIILLTPHACFAPNNVIDTMEDAEAQIFNTLYPGSKQEILSDRLSDKTVLYSMVRGLDGFMSRTLPGARLRSHLGVIAEYLEARQTGGASNVYVDIREGEADIFLYVDGKLYSASVQQWQKPEDLAYRIFNLLNAYEINTSAARIYLSGIRQIRMQLTEILQRLRANVRNMPLPPQPNEELPLPLSLLLRVV